MSQDEGPSYFMRVAVLVTVNNVRSASTPIDRPQEFGWIRSLTPAYYAPINDTPFEPAMPPQRG